MTRYSFLGVLNFTEVRVFLLSRTSLCMSLHGYRPAGIRIHEFQSNRMKRSEYQFIINDPISIPPIGILALPGDAAPQPWLTNAVLHHLQTQTESSYAEEEHEHL